METCDVCDAILQEVLWSDIVFIKGEYYLESLKVDVDYDSANTDQFFDYLIEKYDCTLEEIKTTMFDDIEVANDIYKKFGVEFGTLGCKCINCGAFL